MKLLLDTCAFLWLAGKPSKLSPAAVQAINDPGNDLFLSDASIWEIALKYSKGKLPLPERPRNWIPKQTRFFQIQRVEISQEALLRSGELPPAHPDPFDRLIAAQGLSDSFQIVTPDEPFRIYGASCIW